MMTHSALPTKPSASASTSTASAKQTYKQAPPSAYSSSYRAGFVKLGPTAPPPVPSPDKYHSIHTLEESKKIDALKDTKLNPNLIEDGYDQLAHGLHLWTVVGDKAKTASNISFDEEHTIASNFYDRIIGPAYGHLGTEPMSKELWMKQAYDSALGYKIEDAYTNNWINSLKHGWNSGLASTARAADRVTTMLGQAYDSAVGQWRKEQAWRSQTDDARRQELGLPKGADLPTIIKNEGDDPKTRSMQNWMQRVKDIDHQVDLNHKYDENLIQRGARYQSEHRQFWSDALPSHDGFLNKSTSFVAEQIAQLPIFTAMGPIGSEGKLGEVLGATGIGKKVSGYLLAGTEGLAYGALTHKQDDPGEILRDGIGFAVFHGLFDIAGMGTKKLIDVAPDSWKPKLEAKEDKLALSQKGLRPDTPVETYNAHKTEVANNLFVGGVATQRAIYVDALHYVQHTERMPREVERAHSADLLGSDPERWAPVLSSAKFVRSLLGDKKLSEIIPGSEDEKFLSSRLAQLITDAGSEMNTRVKGMGEEAESQALAKLNAPSAKHTLAYYVQQVQSDLAKNPGAAKMVTPEMIQKAALKKFAEDTQDAAEDAEEETGTDKVQKASNALNRSKPSKVDMQLVTKRSKSNAGETISFKAEPYKVRLAYHKKTAAARQQSLQDYFRDLGDEDFEHDLSAHFYPASLRKAGIFFEGQNTREGMQNPNFLAFMHNYSPQMPPAFAAELEERLTGTVKAQKYMSGRKPTQNQLAYYAGAMYNHMDNLLGSGRWPAEHNVFRSSNENIFETTIHQRELLIEKTIQEQNNLKDMFGGDKKGLKLALQTHSAFSKLRMNEFDQAHPKRNSQELIRGYDELIADIQTSKTGKSAGYKRWKF